MTRPRPISNSRAPARARVSSRADRRAPRAPPAPPRRGGMPAPPGRPAGSRSIASFFRSPPGGPPRARRGDVRGGCRASPAIAEAVAETDRSERERGAEAGVARPGPDPVAPDEASPSPENRGGALSENTPRAVLPWRVARRARAGRPVVAYRRKRRATHPRGIRASFASSPSEPSPAPAPAAPPPRKDKRPSSTQLFRPRQKPRARLDARCADVDLARASRAVGREDEVTTRSTPSACETTSSPRRSGNRRRSALPPGDDGERRQSSRTRADDTRWCTVRNPPPPCRGGGGALTCAEGWAETTAPSRRRKGRKGRKRAKRATL